MTEQEQKHAEMAGLGRNAVVYSDNAWAAARKSSDGSDRWFPDHAASNWDYRTTAEMVAWTTDWEILREGDSR